MTVLHANLLKRMSEGDRALLGKAGLLPEEHAAIAVAKSEKQLQGQLVGLLRRSGLFPVVQRMDKRSNVTVGCPDILFADATGLATAWEAKMPGEHPRPEQTACHEAMRAAGWRVYVVHSYDEARALLARHGDNTEPGCPL